MINISNELSIGSFLNFGYDVTYQSAFNFNYSLLSSEKNESPSFSDAKDLFISCIESSVSNSNSDIIIPISGGLDSRALLAGALETYDSSRIKTYTFGSKASYDYEIGQGIAKELGVSWRGYELSEYDFTEKSLTETAVMFDKQTVLFYQPPYEHIKHEFGSDLFLIGFMGDPIAGSHLPAKTSTDPIEIFSSFYNKNRLVKSCSLYDIHPSSMSEVFDLKGVNLNCITAEESLDFDIRQLKYVYPHVMPKSIMCKSPFLDDRWFKFMMSLSSELRLNQHFYNQFLLQSFPKAFQHPCKNNLGFNLDANKNILKFWRLMHKFPKLRRKMVNYQDFNRRLCVDHKFKTLISSLLIDLEKRELKLKLSPTKLLEEHCQRKAIYSDALIALASLEINLR